MIDEHDVNNVKLSKLFKSIPINLDQIHVCLRVSLVSDGSWFKTIKIFSNLFNHLADAADVGNEKWNSFNKYKNAYIGNSSE